MSTGVERKRKRDVAFLTLAAIGVVFGDIGTSPLYTLRECFTGHYPMPLTPDNVMGILSLIFWSLIIVVTLKYVVFIMRADNNGEGGVLSLLALTRRIAISSKLTRNLLVVAGIFGASLFLGDGMITPAISVLSAVEGLQVAAPAMHHYVIPVTLMVLTALFMVQRKGTARVGVLFGPIMIVWFASLAILGVIGISHNPDVLRALSPYYAGLFFVHHGWASLLVFGAVVLAVTGGEALYADMGHFGRRPIRIAWFAFVLPSLVLNYFGQGSLLLHRPETISNPFLYLAPESMLLPMVILSTCAAVIASQAVISGVFSITRQAVQLGYWPRLQVNHTSSKEEGQIYVPGMNWLLFVAVVVLVLGFRSSSNLASAYGIAVTAAMMVDTMLAAVVARGLWRWSWWAVLAPVLLFITVDSAFLFSNLLKFIDGGWFPIMIGLLMLTVMLTWRRGRKLLHEKINLTTIPIAQFVESLHIHRPVVVPGTAIFMTSTTGRAPYSLLHNIRHNKVLHKRNILLTINTDRVPIVDDRYRVVIEDVGEGFYVVNAYYGFQESPDVLEVIRACAQQGLDVHENDASFFINRERLIPGNDKGLPPIVDNLFAGMHRNAMSVTDYFNIPTNRVVEIGAQIEI